MSAGDRGRGTGDGGQGTGDRGREPIPVPPSPDPPFGRVLAELRARRGWSQSQLAAEAGYTAGYVSRLEAGKREPSRFTVVVLCAVLGLDGYDRGRLLVAAGYVPEPATGWVVVWLDEAGMTGPVGTGHQVAG